MLIFYLFAILMVVMALVFMLPALVRKNDDAALEIDQQQTNVDIARDALQQLNASRDSDAITDAQYATQRAELEQSLALALKTNSQTLNKGHLSARILAVLIAVGLPVSAATIYYATGMPQSMDAEFVTAINQPPPAADKLPPVDELLPQLEAHLASNPGDLRGWRLLGVSYLRLQQFDEAERALEQARALAPDDVDVLMQLIDARAMSRDGKIDPESERQLEHALTLAPDDPRGLWMLGMLRQQQGQMNEAVSIWKRLLVLLENEPEAQAAVQTLLDRAGEPSAGSELTAPAASAEPSTAQAPGSTAAVSIDVSLDPELIKTLAPDTAVFVYAKAMQGPPMPLAVVRKQVSDLPFSVTLTDAMAMMPQLRLSQFEQVIVGARVSLSGDPVAATGDFFSERENVDVLDADAIKLTIDQTVP